MQVFHIVGRHGSRKSTIAMGLQKAWSVDRTCVVVNSDDMNIFFGCDPAKAIAAHCTADILILEHLPDLFKGAQRGDLVIRTEVTE
jgi:ABC-type transport system involved in cytochrome bd biosynthesis fused ATPase/permease subunit